ncbi:MAG: YggT family protein [Desulfovibrio sp.]|jgi:YggT family protein|nr:YggT family protein [Desulfovibrio sp.]
MGVLLEAVDFVIGALINIYFFIVLGACLISWVNADHYNPIVQALRNLTEPVFWRVRKYLPFVVIGGLDFAPVVVMIGLKAIQILISGLIRQLY